MRVVEFPTPTRRRRVVRCPSEESALSHSVRSVSIASAMIRPGSNAGCVRPIKRTCSGPQALSPLIPKRTEEFVRAFTARRGQGASFLKAGLTLPETSLNLTLSGGVPTDAEVLIKRVHAIDAAGEIEP